MLYNTHWLGKNVIVTGGSGFLGNPLVRLLRSAGANVFVPRQGIFDLTRHGDVYRMIDEASHMNDVKIDVLFHLAATVGGIGANQRHPAKFLYDNTTMNLFVAREALKAGVRKLVAVGSVCAYPKFTPAPFKEADIFNGYPEETNAPYGLTKRLLMIYLQALRDQYGFNGVMLFPTNLYGPGDHFGSRDAHVIPMLIERFWHAAAEHQPSVTIWGTGQATRDFLYVDDAVAALEIAARRYNEPDPVNIGTGEEISIIDLAYSIAQAVGFNGQILTDPSKPDGQPRRVLDITRAKEKLGWAPSVNIEDGLKRTVEWYETEWLKQ